MDEILFFKFPGIIAAIVGYRTTERHVINRLSCLVEVTRDQVTNIIIIDSNIVEVFSKAVSEPSPSFPDVNFVAK